MGTKLHTNNDINMKTFKQFYRNTLLRLHFNLENFHGMFTVKGGRPLVNILKGLLILADANVTSGLIRYICHFVVTCRSLIRAQGPHGLVKFLKASGTSVQQNIGGHRVHNAGLLGVRFARTRHGLPRWIPQHIRMRIRAGDVKAIRTTLTLINVYRVIEFPGTLKLKSISAPSTGHGGLDRQILSLMPLFAALFVYNRFPKAQLLAKLLNYSKDSVFAMFKGGPGVQGVLGQWNTMPWILLRAWKAIKRDSILFEAVNLLLGALDYARVKMGIAFAESAINVEFESKPLVQPLSYLGKLGTKEEAAGKVRVFAMVDGWSQWLLYPFHMTVFDILRDVKMDGTFNQVRPLAFLRSSHGLFSLDLTAATDRIPLWLQRALWAILFGAEMAGAIAMLLTGRVYRLHRKDSFEDLRYAVGQPMGALFSWASLAITHHFLVQCAAWQSGHPQWKLYTNYAILGDDIVIGDERVMVRYLAILSSLGIECGLHKSLLSPRGSALEFAKRTLYKGQDVSPVPVREFYAASKGIGAFVETTEKYGLSLPKALQAFGVGWKVRSWLNKPLGKLPARIRLLILAINVPRSPEAVSTFFGMGTAPVAQFHNETKDIMESFSKLELGRMKSSLMRSSNAVVGFNPNVWAKEQVIALRESMKVTKFGYAGRLLADALSNLANLTWHRAKVDNVAMAERLLKEIWAIEKSSDFASLYMEFIRLQKEISARSFHVFSTSRPNPPEIRGIMDPSQVRLWKRWSHILQGSQKLDADK
nr:MAG: putative RNA-dependent RNA polymerase [Mitoviridae sp.]